MKIITLDIETTGLPAKGATYENDFMDYPYIVTIAWKINDGETKQFIINQEGRVIPDAAIDIHGITNEIAAQSPHKLVDALAALAVEGIESDFCIGHNIYFDSSTIKANILRMIENKEVDPKIKELMWELLHKDRRVDTMKSTVSFCNLPGPRGPKWPKLTELHMKLFNETFGAHNSKDDVNATYRCYVKLKELNVI